jgi:hypothetical protein
MQKFSAGSGEERAAIQFHRSAFMAIEHSILLELLPT